jgi:GAF domain-containing protein
MSEASAQPEGAHGDGGKDSAEQRERLLAQAFVRLADTLIDEFDLVQFLQGLSIDSIEILRAEAASVMLADARGRLRLIASSDERMRLLEFFELQDAQSPCLDAFGSGRTVQAGEAEGWNRWPGFAPRASEAGFRVLCSVPLRARADTIGTLNLFRRSGEPFSDAELEIAQAMGHIVTIALIQERALKERSLLAEQLQTALRSRVVIEQAKGMLAEHLSLTVDDTFQLLNTYARNHNRKLTEVARNVVDRQIPSGAFTTPPQG